MKYLFLFLFVLSSCFSLENINLGFFKKEDFLKEKNIKDISSFFLDVPYKSNTLIGNSDTKEKLVIDFTALDCFTFIDTIQALKHSKNLSEFKTNLIETRYKNKNISYKKRKHFFSDWFVFNKKIDDITCDIGVCNKTTKYLNKKDVDKKYLKDIPIIKRDIYYLKAKNINKSKLKQGDYIGIYTKLKGLDVTHTGVIIIKDKTVYFRHASSFQKKVVDVLFDEYVSSKSGVVIYRNI